MFEKHQKIEDALLANLKQLNSANLPEEIKTSEEIFTEFLELHKNEIKGIFKDKYLKNGAWNGMMDALMEVERRYNIVYDMDAIDELDNIIKKYLF